VNRDPEFFFIDVGYVDPLDPRDILHEERDDLPDRSELDREQLADEPVRRGRTSA